MYCTVEQIKKATDFPTEDAPLDDGAIKDMIKQSEEEIESIMHTKFGSIEASGTADGDYSTTTFSDSTQTWHTNEFIDYVAWIDGGTGSGQYRPITANDKTKITVSPVFSTTPDATSTYKIVKLGYENETVTGSGYDTQILRKKPFLNLNSLTINSTSITVANVFTWKSGKIQLASGAETSTFINTTPQLVNVKYVYGVYPIPRIINRLCICIAGIRVLTAQIAGTYDDFTSISLPGGFSGSKGEPYTNIREAVSRFQSEARGIVFGDESSAIGSDFRKYPSYRPWVSLG